MKRLLLLVLVLGVAPFAVEAMAPAEYFECHSSDYGSGWRKGWVDGWKHVMGKHAIPPIAPLPPLPPLGRNSFNDGYQDGFVAGREAAMND